MAEVGGWHWDGELNRMHYGFGCQQEEWEIEASVSLTNVLTRVVNDVVSVVRWAEVVELQPKNGRHTSGCLVK